VPLRLIHLSDIHFQGYGTGWDEDEDQRRELLTDLANTCGPQPEVGGIIVGGDIAFSARPGEYTTARTWLDQVCSVCKVDGSKVWTVPGNHDVDREVISRSRIAREFRSAVRGCPVQGIDQELKDRLSKDPAGEAVMAPFANYNQFAGDFGCGTTALQPHWFDPTLTCDGQPVRLTGINSALVSDSGDSKTIAEHKLVAGSWQCKLPREPGLIHVAVGHHPPEWPRDWAVVEPYLKRAHLVLFGHEHRFAAQQGPNGSTVYVFAGAVGPERLGGATNDEYLPSWAIVTLSCDGDSLVIEVDPHVWHRSRTRFGSHPDGVQAFKIRLELASAPDDQVALDEPPEEFKPISASPLTASGNAQMTSEPDEDPAQRRRLGVRFMSLPPTRRLEIARQLGVIEEPEDLSLPTPKLYETLLTRIRTRNLITELEKELERA